MAIQLKEISAEILQKKFSGDPKKMAEFLKVDLMYVRRITGRAALDGRTQQKAFEFILKILPICEELGIDPARELKDPPKSHFKGDADVTKHIRTLRVLENLKAGRAAETEEGGQDHLPPRGNGGNTGRKSGQKRRRFT